MEYFQGTSQQNPKQLSKVHNKKRLTQEQVRLLERSFSSNKKLEPEMKVQLANQLGVPPRQVAIWYQNKRARWKTQSLELDYNTMQVKLENALAEKRQLERDVKQLQVELRRAQDMVFAFSHQRQQQQQQQQQLPQSLHPHHRHAYNSNISDHHDNMINYNHSTSNSCEDQGFSSSFHHDQDVVSDEDLQLDELYACLIGANGSSSAWAAFN